MFRNLEKKRKISKKNSRNLLVNDSEEITSKFSRQLFSSINIFKRSQEFEVFDNAENIFILKINIMRHWIRKV